MFLENSNKEMFFLIDYGREIVVKLNPGCLKSLTVYPFSIDLPLNPIVRTKNQNGGKSANS